MTRKLRDRIADLVLAIGWQLTWRFGRAAGHMAVIALTCPDCGAHLQSSLTESGKAMRLHDRAHSLLERIDAAKSNVPDHLPRSWK